MSERRAPVNGPPGGTIAWSEHVEAWEAYHRQYRDQDAERIAARGGFGLVELVWQLGHMPVTWAPGTAARRQFERSGVTFAPVALAAPSPSEPR
jgi:hypothetical protein